MEQINSFVEGLHKDANYKQQPENSAKEILNFVQISKEGNLYAIINERGTINMQVGFPTGFRMIGYTVLDTQIIIILAHPTGYSQVGWIDLKSSGTAVYTRALPKLEDINGDTNSELGFKVNKPVDCVARKQFTGDRVLYFTDNNVPFGAVNLDNPPEVGNIADAVQLIPNQKVPIIDFVETLENAGGTLTVGTYHLTTRYKDKSGNLTVISIPSGPVPVVDELRAGGRNLYDGALDGTATNKALKFRITNLDINFPILQILAIKYEGTSKAARAFVIEERPIINGTADVVLTTIPAAAEEITQEELRKIPISYKTAKCIEQKDNRLFLSNLGDSSLDIDGDLQKVANAIEVHYKVNEINFNEDGKSSAFDFVEAYVDPEIDPIVNIFLVYTTEVSDVNIPAQFVLKNPGAFPGGVIAITDYTLLGAPGDGITIGTITYVAQVGAVTLGTATFQASVDEATTAQSLADQINAHPTTSAILTASVNVGEVILSHNTLGVSGNSLVLTYTDNGGGIGATVTGSGTLSGGAASASYTPDDVIKEDTNLLNLVFTPILGILPSWTVDQTDVQGLDTTTYTGINAGITNAVITYVPLEGDSGQFNDYKGELQTTNLKGYQRNEVYSFALAVLFKDGGESFAYHIPGDPTRTGVAGEKLASIPDAGSGVGETSGRCGTYISSLQYPINQNYPGNLVGDDVTIGAVDRQIRHHVMPEISEEPHFRNESGTQKIRILGISFKFVKPIPASVQKRIQSILLLRQERNSDVNTSIFAQGIVDPMVQSYTDYTEDSGNPSSDPIYAPMPGFGNSIIEKTNFQHFTLGSSKKPASIVINTFLDYEKNLAFRSPDTLFRGVTDSQLAGKKIKALLTLKGFIKPAGYEPSNRQYNGFPNLTNLTGNHIGKGSVQLGVKAWLFCDYTEQVPLLVGGGEVVETQISETKFVVEASTQGVESLPNIIDNLRGHEFMYLHTLEKVARSPSASPLIYHYESYPFPPPRYRSFFQTNNYDIFKPQSEQTTSLLNIESENISQYGSIGNAAYMIIKRTNSIPTSVGQSILGVYGGDTFITKFSEVNRNMWENNYLSIHFEDPIVHTVVKTTYNTTNNPPGVKSRPRHREVEDNKHDGDDYRSMSYFFVESMVNTAYRHIPPDQDPNSKAKYYPKGGTPEETLNNHDVSLGASRYYNYQYSFDNAVRAYFAKAADFKITGRFDTRTIFSEAQLEDDTVDNFKVILQQSYHDISKNTGPIWDSFVSNNTLYLHTPKSLWRSFVNTNAIIQAQGISDVVLGTGGVFTRPSEELYTTEGGYAGTISQFGGTNTPVGYIFPDVLQGKVFLLGEGLQELSQVGMINFFNENLRLGLEVDGVYNDNPYTGAGILGVWDYNLKRYLICKKGTAKDFTISYSRISQKWFSEHSYRPSLMIPIDNRLFFVDNTATAELYEMNKGNFGDYMTLGIQPSRIEIVANPFPVMQKTFDNIVVNSDSSDVATGQYKHMDNFDLIQCISELKNSGEYSIAVSNVLQAAPTAGVVKAAFRNGEYRLAIPLNEVVDDTLNITDPSNLDRTKLFRDRIKGMYMRLILTYNNSDNYKFLINFVKVTARKNEL